MTSEQTCDIHTAKSACCWCSQCEQLLCSDCVQYHSQAKISKDHETVSIENFAKLPSFVTTLRRTCDEHDDKADFYCPAHEVLCCMACVQNQHKLCGVHSIQHQSRHIKRSATMEELECSLQDLEINIGDALQDRESNISNIDIQKTCLLQQISEAKRSAIEYFETLEQIAVEDVSDVVKKEKVRQDKLVTDLKEKQFVVSRLSSDLEKIKRYASNIDTFLALQSLGSDVKKEYQYLDSIRNDTSLFHTEIIFEKSESIQTFRSIITSFGKILIVSKPQLLQFKDGKNKQAQLLVNDSDVENEMAEPPVKNFDQRSDIINNKATENGNLSNDSNNKIESENSSNGTTEKGNVAYAKGIELEQSLDYKTNSITGDSNELGDIEHETCVTLEEKMSFPFKTKQLTAVMMLPNEKFVCLDHNGKRLIFLNKRTKNQKIVHFISRPVDLTFQAPDTIAVTLHSAKCIVYLELSSGRKFERVRTDGHCFGIDFDGKSYYVSIPQNKLIHIFGCDRNDISNITTKYGGFYLVKHGDKIVCSNHINSVVFCLSVSGNHLWEIRSNTLLEPFCLSTNLNGDIFVTGRKSKTVNKISNDGRSNKVIISDFGEITIPRALNYCTNDEKLIVCDEKLDMGVIYNI